MDHDFHVGNIIPSVSLLCNIPTYVSGSFFIGKNDRYGQIYTTLRDGVFDGSKMNDHCAQLTAVLRTKGLTPTVLVLQTDGGSDHLLKRIAYKLILTGMCRFRELDLDHLVVL